MSLKGKTVFISGATRGIGREIALRFARDGANIAVTGKTAEPHPKLAGTIPDAAEAVEAAGGKALAIQLDIRDETAIERAIGQTADRFGGIDILVNNASAISLTGTQETPAKRFDLMHQINARGTYLCSRACIPFLEKGRNPHILTLSPPFNLKPRWFKDHLAYTMAKYGMSMCTLGLAAELADRGIAANSLWPRTTIHTAAIEQFFPQAVSSSRTPAIMADAAYAIVTGDSHSTTGRFFIDEDVLRAHGITDFSRYAVKAGMPLATDQFLD
jgi:citronellol/citronellal dehydrogenase